MEHRVAIPSDQPKLVGLRKTPNIMHRKIVAIGFISAYLAVIQQTTDRIISYFNRQSILLTVLQSNVFFTRFILLNRFPLDVLEACQMLPQASTSKTT